MDWVSEAAVSPKITFVSPNILEGPARRNMKTETEIHQKSPGPIQRSITCIHIQVPPRLWKDSANNRPRTGILCSRSGWFFFFLLATPCGTWDPINSSPKQGLNLYALRWEHGVPTTGPPGKSPMIGSTGTSGLISTIIYIQHFPGGTLDENPLANPRGHGFDSWSGKIPHAEGQLSLWATTTEPVF